MALMALASDARTVPQAPTNDPSRRNATVQFVVGNVEYLLVHELAHFLITEKDIPVIGPTEYAADYVATLALIREEPLDAEQAGRAQALLLATAAGFIAAWRAGSASGVEVPYYGIQRYYQPSDGDGAAVTIVYGEPPTMTSKSIQQAIMKIQLFERVSCARSSHSSSRLRSSCAPANDRKPDGCRSSASS